MKSLDSGANTQLQQRRNVGTGSTPPWQPAALASSLLDKHVASAKVQKGRTILIGSTPPANSGITTMRRHSHLSGSHMSRSEQNIADMLEADGHEVKTESPISRSLSWVEGCTASKERRRRTLASLRPEAVVQLHELHENFQQSSPEPVEDTSNEALDATWQASDDVWQVYGALPRSGELPLKERSLRLLAEPSTSRGSSAGRSRLQASGVTAAIHKGRKSRMGDQAYGQDNFSFSSLGRGWRSLCVMDGHGQDGHWPSTRAVRTVPFFLAGKNCTTMIQQGHPEAALIHAFRKTQLDLAFRAREDGINLQSCGSTAVSILWHARERHVWVANCGDSRAALLTTSDGIIAMTQDHKPTVESEKARLQSCGAEVKSVEWEDGVVESRIYVKGTDPPWPGISMSRSLGDLAVKDHGVIAEAEVVRWDCPPEVRWDQPRDSYVLVATDGLWEFMQVEEVEEIVLECLRRGDRNQVVNRLVEEAQAKWALHEGFYCDDITIALVPLGEEESAEAVQSLGGSSCSEGMLKLCSGDKPSCILQ